MSYNKTISIIVPVYNRSAFLDTCIQSIVDQSYPHLDIILVDDGSTDNSLDICNRYAQNDKRIAVISVANGGVSKARNIGIKHAKGDFIQFVDSDDTIKPNMCEVLLKEQQKNNADIVICGFDNMDTDGNHLFYEYTDTPVCDIRTFFDNFAELLQKNLLRSPVNKLYKKQIIVEHDLFFNPKFSIAEDALFNIEYYPHMKSVCVLAQCLYNCINHDDINRLTNKFHGNYFEIQNIFFGSVIDLLKNKKIYTAKNKSIIELQYAQVHIIGLQCLKANKQNLNFQKIYDSLLFEIFPYKGKEKIAHFYRSLACAKKLSAMAYVKENRLASKKIYGLLKVLFWQCVEKIHVLR